MAAAAPAIALMAAGTVAKTIANQQANSQRKNILNQMFAGIDESGKKINALGVEGASRYSADKREPALAEVEAGATQRLSDALAAGDIESPDYARSGKVSQTYLDRSAASDAKETDRRAMFDKMYGATSAPSLLFDKEALVNANTGSNQGIEAGYSRNMANARQTDVQSVIPDPVLSTLGDVAGGVGQGMVMQGYFDKAAKINQDMFASLYGTPSRTFNSAPPLKVGGLGLKMPRQ